jgi:hypothetical protein
MWQKLPSGHMTVSVYLPEVLLCELVAMDGFGHVHSIWTQNGRLSGYNKIRVEGNRMRDLEGLEAGMSSRRF